MKKIQMYCHGDCFGNPGTGGFGVSLHFEKHSKEFSKSYKETTNNRMELRSIIFGLQQLKEKCKVNIYTCSMYIINCTGDHHQIKKNFDLLNELKELCGKHEVIFHKTIKSINNIEFDKMCKLSVLACRSRQDKMIDKGYKK